MCDRDLAPVAVVAAVVCCAATALAAAVVGGVALAAIGRFTAVSVAGLVVVVVIAWRIDRRRHRHDRSADTDDRCGHREEVSS